VHLPDGWTGSADYVFVSLTDAGHMIAPNTLVTTPPPDVPASHRLDLTVAKELWDGHCELLFGVSDVLNTTRDPVGSVPFSSPHDTPGRTFFGRLRIRF
jgi:hypothetical protein